MGLDALAQESDVLFVLAPGGAGTLHMVDAAFLRKMKRTSVLVNAARGSVVDSDALALALQEGWIWGAGLDVVEGEPDIRPGHPLLAQPRYVICLPGLLGWADRRGWACAGVWWCPILEARRLRRGRRWGRWPCGMC